MLAFVAGKILRACCSQNRLIEVPAAPRRYRLAVQRRLLPHRADPALADDRLVDDADDRPTIPHERNQRAEDRPTGDEAACAVDRIEHPGPWGVGPNRAIFLADDAVRRAKSLDDVAHRDFGGLVGLGHRRGV